MNKSVYFRVPKPKDEWSPWYWYTPVDKFGKPEDLVKDIQTFSEAAHITDYTLFCLIANCQRFIYASGHYFDEKVNNLIQTYWKYEIE